jgi:hypothetical protein
MTPREAIGWLQAILDDTLDEDDETDSQRIEAVELAIEALEKEDATPPGR